MGDLSALENESFAYVGTPDQVGSLRVLQKNGHPGANRVKFVFGPYVGTIMYESALESYVRSHGADGLGDIESVRYRDGDWPGYLSVKLTDGRVLKARKFYYNYLIPFHIANSCLMTPDFTNELTDISVGDAWNPTLESSGQGFSVVLARSRSGEDLLLDMESKGLVDLREIDEAEAISMHAHMLDFKKRGSFIRTSIRRRLGRAVPEFDYAPTDIGPSRVAIEMFIGVVLWTSRLRLSIWVSEKIPEPIIGRAFEYVRRSWKAISRSAKRQGLTEGNFEWTDKLKGNKR
jgi:coenzyme F420 hydrogenase subunit beta